MSEKLENAARLVKLVAKVRQHDESAAKFIASYVLAYMEDTVDAMPEINFQPWAQDVNTFCTWKFTPQGHDYWYKLHSKVGSI